LWRKICVHFIHQKNIKDEEARQSEKR